jgi:hypothetical protein
VALAAPRPAAQAGGAPAPERLSPGVSACATCHSGAGGRRANLFVTQYQSDRFVRLDESATWLGEDTHSNAFKALDGPLGRRMAKVLDYDVTRAPQCLACHAVDVTPAAAPAGKRFFVNQGVNCTGCHGLAEAWQVRHYQESPDGKSIPWRASTPAEKGKAGLADLRNPVAKARLCASCHVGSPERGRVLTHAMYAAGHPALPPFELATFLEGQPRHWGYPTELPYFKTVPAGKTWELYRFHPADREAYHARQLAAGAVAGLVAEARLLRANAAALVKAGGSGLDYARFDCYACHHELLAPSDRQERGYSDGPPGRPTLRWGPGALAEVVARHAAGIEAGGLKSRAGGFEARWAALRKAATAKPYGSPKRVLASADELVAWGEGFLKVLQECPEPLYPREESGRLLRSLAAAATAGRTAADPEAAISLTWAYVTLCRGTNGPLPGDRLRALARAVPLTVRAGPYSRRENGKAVPLAPRYEGRMRAVARFEAEAFLGPFRALAPER